MGKIYQALEQAKIVRDHNRQNEVPPAREAAPAITLLERPMMPAPQPPQTSTPTKVVAEKEMASLYQNIESLLAHAEKKIIQFIGSQPGEGTSSVVSNFARFNTIRLGKKVLLLEDCRTSTTLISNSRKAEPVSLEELLRQGQSIARIFENTTNIQLTVGKLAKDEESLLRFLESKSLEPIWQELKEVFDLVIIDSPPLSSSSAGLTISRQVDGVVMVLEADRTRGPVAGKTRDQIHKNGGNLLGVVLNKRRYYIPRILYRML